MAKKKGSKKRKKGTPHKSKGTKSVHVKGYKVAPYNRRPRKK